MDWDQDFGMLTAAVAKLHSGQVRKQSGVPYVIHPLQVVQRISEWGIDRRQHRDTWTSALFHDAIEDTEATPDSLVPLIGEYATHLVVVLTFDPQQESKEAYLASFQDEGKTPIEAVVVKLADRFCNVEDFLRIDPNYAQSYFWKAKSVSNAFLSRQTEVASTFGSETTATIEQDLRRLENFVGEPR